MGANFGRTALWQKARRLSAGPGCSSPCLAPAGPSLGDGHGRGEEDTLGAWQILPLSGTCFWRLGWELTLACPEAASRVSTNLGRSWWLEGSGLRAGGREAGLGRAPPGQKVKVGVRGGLSVHTLRLGKARSRAELPCLTNCWQREPGRVSSPLGG